MKNKNRLEYQAQLSRHDHDISAGYFHTLAPGMIIPQYFHILGPGDSIYYQNHLFARLQNVVTAFRGEIDIHLESFFVPLQMIYTPFGQIFAQTDDYLTSLYHNLSERAGFPVIPFDDDHLSSPYQYPSANPRGSFAGHIECVGKEYTRLLDAFDMNRFHACKWAVPESVEPIDPQLCYQPSCSAWIPAAYQAIYQKCFRNDEFERFSIADYNIDQYFNTGVVGNDRIMRLRYVQRPADYFTTARVSPIASAVNKIGGGPGSDSELFPNNGGSLSTNLYKVNNFLGFNIADGSSEFFASRVLTNDPSDAPNSFVSGSTKNAFANSYGSSLEFMNAANIRALFAVDKFARIWGRADKTYDDQILAHFGIDIPHDVKHDLTRLKHWHVVLQSDPIYGTANIVDGDSELISTIGQVGAQGQCDLNTDQEKFTAPVHGVFMIVAYAVTKPRYFGTFSKLHLLSSRLSFPIPEFDKLGAQPLYSFETDPSVLNELDGDEGGAVTLTRIAWQNRYQEFKKKYNRISLTFMNPELIQEHTPSGTHINVFAPWALSRTPFRDLTNAFNLSQLMPGTEFWERPNALNVVMETPYDSRWSNDYYSNPHRMFETDPIIMDYMCTAKLVSWMSQTGEPDL